MQTREVGFAAWARVAAVDALGGVLLAASFTAGVLLLW
jgi:hypothetical protein